MHSDSPPIPSLSNTVQDNIFSRDDNYDDDDDDDIEASFTSDIQSSHSIQGEPNDVGLFGNITEKLREVCTNMSIDHFRNKANEYPETKRDYSGENRFLNPSAFTCVLPNGEVVTRDWLVYSPSKTSVFCFPCMLFSSDRSIKLCASGDNDWKIINQTLKIYQRSAKHIESTVTSTGRSTASDRIDEKLHKTMRAEKLLEKCTFPLCCSNCLSL